jgi:hypothetical protein
MGSNGYSSHDDRGDSICAKWRLWLDFMNFHVLKELIRNLSQQCFRQTVISVGREVASSNKLNNVPGLLAKATFIIAVKSIHLSSVQGNAMSQTLSCNT